MAKILLIFGFLISVLSCGKNPVESLCPQKRMSAKNSEGVYYSIFVRSFADSDGDGIGDINGIIQKLDYLNDGDDSTTTDLGVTGIWLLPIFPSPSYHGYDATDYYKINPDYGTLEDFEHLASECRKRGISLIIDMMFNHSSSMHDWFQKSRDPESRFHSWYNWANKNDSGYAFGQSIWGHKIWNADSKNPENLYSGLFFDGMPDYNLDCQELRCEFMKILDFWISKGVSGFRFDAAGHVYNTAKLKSGTEGLSKAVEWWKSVEEHLDEKLPDQYSVCEVWEGNSTRAEYIRGVKSNFHFNMGQNYIIEEVKSNNGGNNTFSKVYGKDIAQYREKNPSYIDAPFISNHDLPRVSSLLKGDVNKLKLAAGMYLLAEGVPFIYYGEEIGMKSGAKDPSKRTPMLWNDRFEAKWASPEDCIYNKNTESVKVQQSDKSSLLNYYKRLIRLRTSHSAFFKGKFSVLDTGTEGISSWCMCSEDENMFVIHNLSKDSRKINLPEKISNAWPVFYSSSECHLDGRFVSVPQESTVVIGFDK